MMERWIPREKLKKAGVAAEQAPVPQAAVFGIEGLDVARGIARTGDSEAHYIEVLKLFTKDAAARLKILETLKGTPETELPLLITQAHALKSASASIGAEDISRMAAELEKAGLNNEFDSIKADLDTFHENLSVLVGKIKLALAESAHSSENVNDGERGSEYPEALSRLRDVRDALLTENVGRVDALLKELETMPLDSKTKETLSETAVLALTSEFANAAGMIEGLIKGLIKDGFR